MKGGGKGRGRGGGVLRCLHVTNEHAARPKLPLEIPMTGCIMGDFDWYIRSVIHSGA